MFGRTKRRRGGTAGSCIVGVTASLALLLAPAREAPAAVDFQSCERCHGGTLDQQLTKFYQHSPFNRRQCAPCHSASESLPALKTIGAAAPPDESRRIYWLEESPESAYGHWFVVPSSRVREVLIVEGRGAAGTAARQEVSVPRLSTVSEVKDVGRAPEISKLKVVEVQRAVFLTATIAWETDVVADEAVRYGTDSLSHVASGGRRYGRRHEVVLYDLEPNKTYRVAAVSRDLFGRTKISEPLTLSTAQAVAGVRAAAAVAGEPPGFVTRFQRLGEDYVVEVTLDRPAAAAIGVRGPPAKPARVESVARAAVQQEDPHAALSSKFVASLESCKKCHQGPATATHPVNVLPKPGMIIPPEYPRLPDGRITCVTCHDVHASNYEYLLLKPKLRDLCVGCHRSMK